MADELIHDLATDKYTIMLDNAPDAEGLKVSVTNYELRRVFMLLISHFCETSPEVTHSLKGLVTVDNGDGFDRITEEVGAPKSAQWRAKKAVEDGTAKGARAWLNIGNYGICAHNSPTLENDNEPEEPAPTVTLDKWGIV